jgi:uncharacterized protein YukE
MLRIRVALVSLISFAACGPSTTDEASSVNATSQELQALVERHTSAAASVAPASCASEMQSYRDSANRMVASMSGMCPGLDTCMSGMGHSEQSDMAAGARDMQGELEVHVANGCSVADPSAEMARHRQAMLTHTGHLMTRSQAMMEMMAGRGMMQWQGCH